MAAWEELAELGPPLLGVYGNMDATELLVRLPEERTVEVAGARIGMVHIAGPAAGRAERLRERFPGCGAVVYGHTHVPELTLHDDFWILNPGSPTERRTAPSHAMLVVEVEAGEIRPQLVEL